jgi:hypothetical protein
MKFKALNDSDHIDPKKGSVKITLVAASHVSLDELTTLSPKDETVQVTLESEQNKIDVYPPVPPEGDSATQDVMGIDEEGAEWLKKKADGLRDSPDAKEGEEDE